MATGAWFRSKAAKAVAVVSKVWTSDAAFTTLVIILVLVFVGWKVWAWWDDRNETIKYKAYRTEVNDDEPPR